MSGMCWRVVAWPLLAGYIAWRWVTCLVDARGDLVAGRVPAYWRCRDPRVDVQTLRWRA